MKSIKKIRYLVFILVTVFLISTINFKTYGSGKISGDVTFSDGNDTISIKKDDVKDVGYNINPKPISVEDVNSDLDKDIVLVLDTSLTMEGNLDGVKKSAIDLVSKFYGNSNVKIGLVQYTLHGEVLTNDENGNPTMFNAGDKENLYKIEDYRNNYTYFRRRNNKHKSKKNYDLNNLDYSGNLITSILDMNASYGTNTGEGLRFALNLLNSDTSVSNKNKYVIFMSDGTPQAYTSSDKKGKNLYYKMDYKSPYVLSGKRAKPNAKKYAYNISKSIGEKGFNSYSIYFGNPYPSREEIMGEINRNMGGEYYNATNIEALNKKFTDIANDIDSSYLIKTKLNLNLPNDMSIKSAKIIKKDGTSEEINLDDMGIDINYKLSEDKKEYKAEPFKIVVQYEYKGKIVEENINYNINGKLTLDNSETFADLPQLGVNIKPDISVSINVNDGRGNVGNPYSTLSKYIKVNNGSFDMLGEVKDSNKLFGQSFANIKVKGTDTSNDKEYFFHYVLRDSSGKELSYEISDGTMPIDSEGNIINYNDIEFNKPGFLTSRAYDVSHLKYMDDSQWTDRKNIFANPLDKTVELPTTYIPDYFYDYIRKDKRQSAFFEKMDMSNYKESNKYWGYIKPKENGWYILGGYADDGISTILTTNEGQSEFVKYDWGINLKNDDTFWEQHNPFREERDNRSNFEPHRALYYSNFKPIYLKSTEYYPVFVEYYNYGGYGAFKLGYNSYKTENDALNSVKNINEDDKVLDNFEENIKYMGGNNNAFQFYPSKSITPGETATATFTGEPNIKLADSTVPYYIDYDVYSLDKNKKRNEIIKGKYGYFEVEKLFDAKISFEEKNKVYKGMKTNIYYEVVLEKISSEGIAGGKPITIKNIKVNGLLPKGLTFIANSRDNLLNEMSNNNVTIKYPGNQVANGTNFTIEFKNPITYVLSKDKKYYEWDGKSGKYNSSDTGIRIPVSVNIDNTSPNSLSFTSNNNILTYSYENSSSIITQYFNNVTMDLSSPSTIDNIGLLDYDNGNKVVNENNIDIAGGIPSKVAIGVDVKSPNTIVDLTIDNGNINKDNLKIYEVDGNGNIIGEAININGNDISIANNGKTVKVDLSNIIDNKNFTEKKYVIVSEITTPKVDPGNSAESVNITASIENNPDSSKKKELSSGKMPDVF